MAHSKPHITNAARNFTSLILCNNSGISPVYMAEQHKRSFSKMNKLIKKIACAGIALMFVLGAFTGCKSEKTGSAKKADLPSFTSVKDPNGTLAQKGKAGEIEYSILDKSTFGTNAKKRGYYVDQLEQLDSPYFIVISAGSKTKDGYDINITDLGMQGSTLVIIVNETVNPGEKNASTGDTPCCVLEIGHDNVPEDIRIVSTSGEEFKLIEL